MAPGGSFTPRTSGVIRPGATPRDPIPATIPPARQAESNRIWRYGLSLVSWWHRHSCLCFPLAHRQECLCHRTETGYGSRIRGPGADGADDAAVPAGVLGLPQGGVGLLAEVVVVH